MTSEGAWRHAPTVAVVTKADHVVVLDLRDPGSRPAVLTGTGLAVWSSITSEATTDDIIGALATEFDVPTKLIGSDVQAFLGELSRLGLITAT